MGSHGISSGVIGKQCQHICIIVACLERRGKNYIQRKRDGYIYILHDFSTFEMERHFEHKCTQATSWSGCGHKQALGGSSTRLRPCSQFSISSKSEFRSAQQIPLLKSLGEDAIDSWTSTMSWRLLMACVLHPQSNPAPCYR